MVSYSFRHLIMTADKQEQVLSTELDKNSEILPVETGKEKICPIGRDRKSSNMP